MASTQSAVEAAYRKMLENKKPAVKTNRAIIAWLKGLGTAISAWEARWLRRLENAEAERSRGRGHA